jgi:hypothetical protein
MVGIIRIEIHPTGLTQVFLSQSDDNSYSQRLWQLYQAIRPKILELKEMAREEAPKVASSELGHQILPSEIM